jgi:hypothetical protein
MLVGRSGGLWFLAIGIVHALDAAARRLSSLVYQQFG